MTKDRNIGRTWKKEGYDITILNYVKKGGQGAIYRVQLENEHGIHSKDTLLAFAESVKQHREDMIKILENIHRENKRIVAISMPAKGVALLNYCGIDKRLIQYATERSELKIGKFAPGSHIPIKSDDFLLDDKPDYALLLAWNFEKEIIANNQEFLNQGGKFIIPIPQPRIVSQ